MLTSASIGFPYISGGRGTLVWKKAGATAVLAICTVLIVNIVDPAHQLYSWEWFKHMLIAAAMTTAVMEAKYWRDWASKILGNGGNGAA